MSKILGIISAESSWRYVKIIKTGKQLLSVVTYLRNRAFLIHLHALNKLELKGDILT